jgi:hypothetical protein
MAFLLIYTVSSYSPCLYNDTELRIFQAINSPNKPLSSMATSEREKILVSVAEVIKKRLVNEKT